MASKGSEIPIGDGSLHIGDRVVYPNQGICRITGVEVKQIAGRDWEVVTLSREEDGATVMVPRTKVMGIGLRKVASVAAIDDMFDQLATPDDDPQLDWKVRHRENADRMTGGGLQGTIEVLKGLHALSRVRPLPQRERELYDNARHLLVGEIAAAMNLPPHIAEDNLDYALWPPPGMKRKGRPLQPAPLGVPGGSVGATGSRAAAVDEDLDLEEEVPAPEPPAEDVEEEVGDASETKDLVRARAARVVAAEDEPEPLDELARDALEATHEAEAAAPARRTTAPPGSERPQRPFDRPGAPRRAPAAKAAPPAGAEPKAHFGSTVESRRPKGERRKAKVEKRKAKVDRRSAKAKPVRAPAKPAKKASAARKVKASAKGVRLGKKAAAKKGAKPGAARKKKGRR